QKHPGQPAQPAGKAKAKAKVAAKAHGKPATSTHSNGHASAHASVHSSSSAQGTAGQKVLVCHKTGSATNPYVVISISINGWTNGHSKHSGDILLGPSTPGPHSHDASRWPSGGTASTTTTTTTPSTTSTTPPPTTPHTG